MPSSPLGVYKPLVHACAIDTRLSFPLPLEPGYKAKADGAARNRQRGGVVLILCFVHKQCAKNLIAAVIHLSMYCPTYPPLAKVEI